MVKHLNRMKKATNRKLLKAGILKVVMAKAGALEADLVIKEAMEVNSQVEAGEAHHTAIPSMYPLNIVIQAKD